MTSTPAKRRHLLDALRGLCAVLVSLRHETTLWGFDLFRTYLAVDLFFLMSGYVLTANYADELESRELTVAQFAVIRLIRFLPVYWLSIAVALLANCATHSTADGGWGAGDTLQLVKAALLLPNLSEGTALFPLQSVAWSLFFELILNLVLAATLRHAPKLVVYAMTGFFGLLMVRYCLWYGGADRGYSNNIESVILGFSRAGFGIFTGYIIARLDLGALSHRASHQAHWWALALMLAALLIPSAHQRWDGWIDALLIVVAFPAAMSLLAQASIQGLASSISTILGAASYPLYLLHEPIGKLVGHAFPNTYPSAFWAAVFSSLLIAACVVIDRRYDMPLRKLLKAWSRKLWAAPRPVD